MEPAVTSQSLATIYSLSDALDPVYGTQTGEQAGRYRQALEHFWRRYGAGPAFLFRAPGRINLIGGHTDYNHGYVMPVALDRDILLVARPRHDPVIRLENIEPEFPVDAFEISEDVSRSETSPWGNYVRGAAQMLARLAPASVTGMDCLVVGKAPYGVPRGSGVSSSSALTVAAAIALAHFAGLQIDRETFASMCSDAEWYVGTRGGIMDQFISLLAQRNHALFLDCRPRQDGHYRTRHVPLPDEYEILIADSGIHHDNARGRYNLRVASCRSGVGILRSKWPDATHLRDLEGVEWEQIEPLLPVELSVADALERGCQIDDIPGLNPDDRLRVRACCRHVWHENRRVQQALSALENADVSEVGRLITLAHASARDDYNISFPEMETLVSTAAAVPGMAGGRITGAGWGGCALFLVRRESVGDLRLALERRFLQEHGRVPAVFPCRFGAAAGYIATVDASDQTR